MTPRQAADLSSPARARFRNRREAGRALGDALAPLASQDPVVIALPRGGVPVGFEVATALGAPLDIGLVRKLGAPMQPELGIGALGETGDPVIDEDAVRSLGITEAQLRQIIERERAELVRRRQRYRPVAPAVDVDGRLAIVVDDGLATGATAAAAARVLRAIGARKVVLAVPVCPRGAEARIRPEYDELVCLASPEPFLGVGGGYDDFTQTTDDEVLELLAEARRASPVPHWGDGRERSTEDDGELRESEVRIDAGDGAELTGTLRIPAGAEGLVIFAHGSGSGRLSPRNRTVAADLNHGRFATLLFDLLTESESAVRANVFDIELLSERLIAAQRWARASEQVGNLPIGLFGASTGAAAALRAAAEQPADVAAVVSRGGRADIAGDALGRVACPVQLIVGGEDRTVLDLNRDAADSLEAPHQIVVVPGAGHLFEEPGAMEQVSQAATSWFRQHVKISRRQRPARGFVD